MSTWHARAKVATKGIRFECQRCSECCTGEVVLTYEDIERILQKYPDLKAAILPTLSHRYPGLGWIFSILHVGQPDRPGVCFYLKEKICTIYDARPLVCRIYPFSVELKRDMKKKTKVPKHAPVFRHPSTHLAYVTVYDPECRGIGKGEEVNLEKVAFLEFQNIYQMVKTYKTELKDKIWNLLGKEQELRTADEYISGMKVITQFGKKAHWKGKDIPLQIVIGYNPKDVNENAAKQIVNLAYDDWNRNFPRYQGSFFLYNFSDQSEFPPKMILVYIGCEPLKERLIIKELEQCWFVLMASEKLREDTKITLGFRKVTFKDGEWGL